MQNLTPQQVSLRNQWAHAMNSISRFDSEFIINNILPRERARNRATREAGGTVKPADLVYLRAALDSLESRGIVNV